MILAFNIPKLLNAQTIICNYHYESFVVVWVTNV